MALNSAPRLTASNITDEQLGLLLGLLDAKDEQLRRTGATASQATETTVELTVELPAAQAEGLLRTALERGTTVSELLAGVVAQSAVGVPSQRSPADPQADGVEWFNVQQLAELAKVPASRVYAAVGAPGGPNPVRVGPNGGRILVHRAEATRWVRSNRQPAAA